MFAKATSCAVNNPLQTAVSNNRAVLQLQPAGFTVTPLNCRDMYCEACFPCYVRTWRRLSKMNRTRADLDPSVMAPPGGNPDG
jgi:hypothetical protein